MNVKTTCRACLRKGKVMHSLYRKPRGIQTMTLGEKLINLTAVKVEIDDGLPDKICDDCVCQVNAFYSFKFQVECSDHALRIGLKNHVKPEKAGSESLSNDECESLMIMDDFGAQSHSPGQCVVSCDNDSIITHFAELNGVLQIVENHEHFTLLESVPINDENEQPVPNNACGSHVRAATVKEENLQESGTEEPKMEEFNIASFSPEPFVFNNAEQQQIEVKMEPVNLIAGGEEETEAGSAPSKSKQPYAQKANFSCSNCMATFVRKGAFVIHQMTNACKAKKLRCDICNKMYSSLALLKAHRSTHSTLLSCVKCQHKFSTQDALNNHMVYAHRWKYQCHICNRAFQNITLLRRHERMHTAQKPFQCTICGRRFTRADNMRSHQQRHEGKKSFHCEHCGMTFVSSTECRIHERIHTEKKPFGCHLCSASFTRQNNLVRHVRMHTDQ